jgi:hypothetical protein
MQIQTILSGHSLAHPIMEQVPITKHFPIFWSFLNQIEQFCVIGRENWRATNVLGVSEVKEQCRKTQDKDE